MATAFLSVCAPRLWNELPEDIKQAKSVDTFKGLLKTHLFKAAYLADYLKGQFYLVQYSGLPKVFRRPLPVFHVVLAVAFAEFPYK